MTPIKITIPGRPITKKNHSQIIKVHNRLMVVPSKEYKTYEATAGWYIHHKGLMIKTPVQVKCLYYMPTKGRVDLGNLLAGTCDLLVHHMVLSDDNSKIMVSHDGSRVLYDKDNPRVEIEITEVEN